MKTIRYQTALLCLLIWGGPLRAHPGHDGPPNLRTWHRADGTAFEAAYVCARDGRVLFYLADESIAWVEMEQLGVDARSAVVERIRATDRVNREETQVAFLAADELKATPIARKAFEPFKDKLELRNDETFLYVGSDGMPDHPMMKGITAWQQQVPLPQPYTGNNAWRIPLKPKMADKPVSAKNNLFRGAIALAANGVPIFNALNNRGEDSYLIGELDEYGGHCGRADDYHYHAAPVHLEKIVGKGNPIGYALDGYPLYGFTDASGKEPKDLDEFNGRMEKDGYRYYSTRKYPYINGGMRGEVTVFEGQVDPQPRAGPVRPAGLPLRGAKITDFVRDDTKKAYVVKYDVNGKPGSVAYTINSDGTYSFTFKQDGKETTETYRRRELKEGKKDPPAKKDGKDNPPKKDKKDPPPKKDESSTIKPRNPDGFTLNSPAFEHGGNFPEEFTGDGDGISPPLKWANPPKGTVCYALQLWHQPGMGEDVKSYWVVYNIPANVTELPKNSKEIGRMGYNGKGRPSYDPMNSKGPGTKDYHITMYALSAEPKFASERVTRDELLKAVKDITLAESTLSYRYTRTFRKEGKKSD